MTSANRTGGCQGCRPGDNADKGASKPWPNSRAARPSRTSRTPSPARSQARNKYTYFASAAKKEGYEQIAAIFLETAEQEKEHAKLHLKLLEGIGDTKANLIAAAGGENHEWTSMYPGMAATAREEGFDDIARLFDGLAKIEKEHEARYKKLLANFEAGTVFARPEKTKWVCRNCGYDPRGQQAARRRAPSASTRRPTTNWPRKTSEDSVLRRHYKRLALAVARSVPVRAYPRVSRKPLPLGGGRPTRAGWGQATHNKTTQQLSPPAPGQPAPAVFLPACKPLPPWGEVGPQGPGGGRHMPRDRFADPTGAARKSGRWQAQEGVWLTASRDRPARTMQQSSKQENPGQPPVARVSRHVRGFGLPALPGLPRLLGL